MPIASVGIPIRRSGCMADGLNVAFCDWCGSWLMRAGLLFWSPARLPVTAPVPSPSVFICARLCEAGCRWPPAGFGRAWRYGRLAGARISPQPVLHEDSPRAAGCGSRARPLRLRWARRDGSRKGQTRGARPSGGSPRPRAEPSLGCYVLRGWRVSPRGMDLGGGPWAEGRQGHVGCGEARQGPPALAHRHRLGLCGERARPARAAGITGGCHGLRVDRASPGPPDRRRKPPARHPQLAGQPRPHQRLPRPGIGFLAPAGGYPAGGCLRPPARPGVPLAARKQGWVPGGDQVARVAPQVAVLTASPPAAPAWCVAVGATGSECLPRPAVTMWPGGTLGSFRERGHGRAALCQRRALVQPGEPVHGPGEARAAASQPP
jgi:hypothetical protein